MKCVYAGKEYSEGSLICVNGRELKCRGDAWEDTGLECGQQNGRADEFPEITDEERVNFETKMADIKHLRGWNKVFADHWSVREDLNFFYFKAAPTMSHVCAGSLIQSYKVPKEDVRFGSATMCPPGGTFYRETDYFWP
ncbi:DUF1496 domain-containing protein [bacterium]|nr:MAG: DUF1496 domain-containing protein [bacterium]